MRRVARAPKRGEWKRPSRWERSSTIAQRLLLAWLHLLALAIGLAGVWARARALRDSLRDPEDRGALRRAFIGDSWWGVAAGVWLITGLWRLIAGTEKGTSYYFANHAFQLKMALFVAILALEVWPMMTLLRWRTNRAAPNPRDAGRIEVISYVECALVVGMVLAAVTMARGYGMASPSASAPSAGDARATPRGRAAPSAAVDDSAGFPAMTPSGSETVTADDLALLSREITMPLDGVNPATLRSNFDERRGGGARQHQALDIMAARRTPVRSAASGRVLKLFTSAAGGLMVYAADSSERFVLMYAHLDGYAPGLRDGAPLSRGQVIGYVGSTGNASANAPHLHFAIARSADVKRWSKGKPIDPLPVLIASAAR
jgi:murein DD-endopeptidase MepM/ murein hydrolase activator NlpD